MPRRPAMLLCVALMMRTACGLVPPRQGDGMGCQSIGARWQLHSSLLQHGSRRGKTEARHLTTIHPRNHTPTSTWPRLALPRGASAKGQSHSAPSPSEVRPVGGHGCVDDQRGPAACACVPSLPSLPRLVNDLTSSSSSACRPALLRKRRPLSSPHRTRTALSCTSLPPNPRPPKAYITFCSILFAPDSSFPLIHTYHRPSSVLPSKESSPALPLTFPIRPQEIQTHTVDYRKSDQQKWSWDSSLPVSVSRGVAIAGCKGSSMRLRRGRMDTCGPRGPRNASTRARLGADGIAVISGAAWRERAKFRIICYHVAEAGAFLPCSIERSQGRADAKRLIAQGRASCRCFP